VEHVVVVVGLAKKESEDGDSCSVFGRADMFEDGRRRAAVGLEGEEVLGSEGLVIGPPGGEDPSMGPGFDEVLGNLERGAGGVWR
jgi:hypothetical protein